MWNGKLHPHQRCLFQCITVSILLLSTDELSCTVLPFTTLYSTSHFGCLQVTFTCGTATLFLTSKTEYMNTAALFPDIPFLCFSNCDISSLNDRSKLHPQCSPLKNLTLQITSKGTTTRPPSSPRPPKKKKTRFASISHIIHITQQIKGPKSAPKSHSSCKTALCTVTSLLSTSPLFHTSQRVQLHPKIKHPCMISFHRS